MTAYKRIIRLIEELHRPIKSPFGQNPIVCLECSNKCEHEGGTDIYYPCPTIQLIEEEAGNV